MMEESSDESAELVDKEEAVSAEKLFEAQQASKPDETSIAPPAPLPSFLTSPGGTPTTPLQATSPKVPVTPTTPPATPSIGSAPQGVRASSPPAQGQVNITPTGPMVPTQATATITTTHQQITPPMPQQSPFEVSSSITVPEMEVEEGSSVGSSAGSGGLFGWISGNRVLSKVVEKTKSSMESMITTLDPGMKEIIKSGGDVCILVTSTKDNKVGAVREAFQTVFGRATVYGMESKANTAAQPVGYTSGVKGAEERIQNLRQTASVHDDQPIVSVEGFIVEMLPDRWYELSCLVLQDPHHRIDLQTFSQPNPIPAEYILKAQDRTPSDYPLRWCGLNVTIGQIVEEACPHIGHADWQAGIVGVSRRESLFLAAKLLAYMYKQRLPTTYVS
ncbi:protein PRRC1-A-like isoform X2 [Mya arenaria]|nr:protein PRRC1-A-like isoform X2 [Mya arenaria]XP_052793905.1 protein PRRC1-A-like isoform X2 [Mya arenaria]